MMPTKLTIQTRAIERRGRAVKELRDFGANPSHRPLMAALYRRVEAQMRTQPKLQNAKPKPSGPAADSQRLLHELQVHQVELEMQNEELRKTRDEMEEGRDKYSDLYDFAPVGYLTLDGEGTIAEANLAGASLLGVARAALVKRRFGAFVSPADRSAFAAFLQRVFKSKAREECDVRLLLRGTDAVDVRMRAIVSSLGQTCRVAVSDVSAYKQAEDKVRLSEVRYRRLFETALDGVLLIDPATRKITDANPFMTKLLGYPHDQFVGKELFEIGLLKDEAASQEMFQKLRRDREVRCEDLLLESRRGRHQQVAVVANLYHENGHAVIQCNIRDITGRKLAEQELSEKARLLDLSHDAIVVRDVKGRIRYWNHGAEELYGWSRKEALGKISHRLFHTEYLTPLKQLIEELFRTGRWIGELVHQTRDGRRITVLVRKTLDRDSRGKPASVLENITDITERKQGEEALRASEERFRAAVGVVSSLIWTNNAKGLMEGEQPGWGNFTGQTLKEYQGYGWAKAVHPHDAPPTVAAWKRAVAKKSIFEFEHRVRRRDGAWRLCSIRAVPVLNDDGQIREWVGVHTDITERKRAEEALSQSDEFNRSIIKSSPDCIKVLDLEGNLLSFLHGAKDLLGIKDVRPYLNKSWVAFWKGQARQAARTAVQTAAAGGEGKFVGFFRTLLGEPKWWDVAISPILNAQGQFEQLLAVSRDITARREAEETQRRVEVLAASNRKLHGEIMRRQAVEESLRKSEQHQTQLLAQSHRLQEQLRQLSRQILTAQEDERLEISRELHDVIAQTLTGINVRLSGLRKEASRNTKGLDRNIARTQRQVEKSVDIVHQFARELRPAMLDDLGLIPALHAFMKSFTTRTGILTSLKAAAKVQQLDPARRTVLYRVAQEALTNVARHAKASRVDVSIKKLPGSVCMRIKDDGQSFDVERVLRTTGKGRLGLLGMRERVEMVGGCFEVESAPGQGTTIVAHLPPGKNRTQGAESAETKT